MDEISPEAQAMMDRLARMDSGDPRHDKPTIERAIAAHLKALNLPERPVAWLDDNEAARERLDAAIIGMLPAFADHRTWPDWQGTFGDVAWSHACRAAEHPSRDSVPWSLRRTRLDLFGSLQGSAAVWRDTDSFWRCDDDFSAVESALRPIWLLARDNFSSFREFERLVWEAVLDGVYDVFMTALPSALEGIAKADTLARTENPATVADAAIWRPMLDAFEAGLLIYYVQPQEVICVLQPRLAVENGRLHCADGPAVVWPSGKQYFFWRGVQVPAWVVMEQRRITVGTIRAEANQEIRRCMVEIYGRSRYLQDSGARLLHEDAFGRLWEADGVEGERWRFVEVENGTPESDGTRRAYILDVTGAAEILGWPVDTARAAVAATYGLRPEEYRPDVRT